VSSFIGKARKAFNKSTIAFSRTGQLGAPYSSMALASSSESAQRTMGSVGTVFAIVTLLAQSAAAPEWKLYRKPPRDGRVRYTTGDQGSDERTEVVAHQAAKVLNRPNPFYTRQELFESTGQHMELCGEAYWIVSKLGGTTIPDEVWPVRPDRIQAVPDPETFIKGYVYTSPDGVKVPIPVDEIIHFKYPNPLDMFHGLGPVQAIMAPIHSLRYANDHARQYFTNGAMPGGIVTSDGEVSDDDWNELTNRWREAHQGVSRAHRIAVLDNGLKFVSTSDSMKDMQFPELINVSRDQIREAWGIHKSMLGNSDDVNRANAETAREDFGLSKVLPRLDRFRMILNERFLPMFGSTGEGVEFDYVNPLREDRESANIELTAKTNALVALIGAGFDPEEACETVGLPVMTLVEIAQPAAPVDPESDNVVSPPEPAPEPTPAAPPVEPAPKNEMDLIHLFRKSMDEDLRHHLNGHAKAGM
jgi:HK97 family phage portal protein